MPTFSIPRLVEFCTRNARFVIAGALVLSCLCAVYTAQHFRLATDTRQLFPRDLPWVERAWHYIDRFPEQGILVVVDAPTPELADQASAGLVAALTSDHEQFRSVEALQSNSFFARNALLYLPKAEVEQIAGRMGQAAPLIQALSADPSLRGALTGLNFGLLGAANGFISPGALAGPMNMAADTVDDVFAGRPAHFSWRLLAQGKPAEPRDLRRFIQVQPVLDFAAVEPGRAASDAIEATARKLDLSGTYQARVRLTGPVPMNDLQFSVLQEHAVLNGLVTLSAVLLILWLALRSWRTILAALIGLICGLTVAAALGLLLVGTLNPLSVAFFVLFVGLGLDFGLQFAVRYRAERYDTGALRPALLNAARKAGGPLALAGIATALGFFSFVPTSYRGLSELGLIAGCGMIVAFLASITLVPALIAALNPPAESAPMRMAFLAPVDRFLERHRFAVVALTVGAVVLGAPLLYWLRFDFNPLHLQSPKAEAVATFLELRKDPRTGANAIELLKPDLKSAEQAAARLDEVPEVARTRTIADFRPGRSGRQARRDRPRCRDTRPGTPPGTEGAADRCGECRGAERNRENAVAIRRDEPRPRRRGGHRSVGAADQAGGGRTGGASAGDNGVCRAAARLARGARGRASPERSTIATLPEALRRAWMAPDGEARAQVLPKGDPDDTEVLRRFVTAVLAVEPDATGPAVMLYEAGNTILRAFIEAGVFALVSIFVLLWVTLRRLRDVAVTLVPLLLAALLTLELSVVLGMPLNFANVIALPLLLGRRGRLQDLLRDSVAPRPDRARPVDAQPRRHLQRVTTGIAFGSLSLSSHPGTSSMGQMMMLALFCTMSAAVLFQPALMGPPRKVPAEEESRAASRCLPKRKRTSSSRLAGPAGLRDTEAEHRREHETVSR